MRALIHEIRMYLAEKLLELVFEISPENQEGSLLQNMIHQYFKSKLGL